MHRETGGRQKQQATHSRPPGPFHSSPLGTTLEQRRAFCPSSKQEPPHSNRWGHRTIAACLSILAFSCAPDAMIMQDIADNFADCSPRKCSLLVV